MKRQWGCEEDIAEFDFFGEKLTRCPRRLHLDDPQLISEALRHYGWFKEGHLPAEGTWLDQTDLFIQTMEVLKSAVSTIEREKLARARSS